MAIIIPSKNIYEVNNQKVRTNVIDNISVEKTIITPTIEDGASVYSHKTYISDLPDIEGQAPSIGGEAIYSEGSGYQMFFALAYFARPKFFTQHLKIPILYNNKYIKRIIDGIDSEGELNIKYNTYGKIEEGQLNVAVSNAVWEPNPGYSILKNANIEINYDERTITKVNEVSYTIPHTIIAKAKDGEIVPVDVSAKTTIATIGNIGDKFIKLVNSYYEGDLELLCGIYEIYGWQEVMLDQNNPNITNFNVVVSYKKYIPTILEINVYGDIMGIDLTDGTITYGSGNKPLSLERNELLQDIAEVTKIDKDGNAITLPLTEHLADNVLSQYKNGKETAELLCDINDYKDYESDKVAISTSGKPHYPIENITFSDRTITIPNPLYNDLKVEAWTFFPSGQATETITIKGGETSGVADYGIKELISAEIQTEMIFRIHDKVIPMVFGANGQDRPMSNYKDGSPKVFEVVGTEMIYDGAVWQKLFLQEFTEIIDNE